MYSFDRSSQLRCLTLKGYYSKENALTNAIKNLPQMEELHLIKAPSLSVEQVESIGISCPKLKSFTYDENGIGSGNFWTEHVVAIGKTMPNLRHLRIKTMRIENEGLEAILNGCPHLESLDLRRLYDLDLEGTLGKRCSDRIKHLKLSFNYSEYPEYEDSDYEHEYVSVDLLWPPP